MTAGNTGKIKKTPLYKEHISLGARMVEFAGWNMPLQYEKGISIEHLATRKDAGLFDISHMGRFIVKGRKALPFLQHVLSSNAAALEVGESQYTIIPDNDGKAIDDAYLYRFYEDRYLLVVNASNKDKDLEHLNNIAGEFKQVNIIDVTEMISMISIQGPRSEEIMLSIISSGSLPEPLRNKLSIIHIDDIKVLTARTGYTGEPLGFELFIDTKHIRKLWTLLLYRGTSPVGLGARDTLRLEAGLPLYGHELGSQIPVFALVQSRLAVSFSSLKSDYIGKSPLETQYKALKKILEGDFSMIDKLPGIIVKLELVDKGIARRGDRVFFDDKDIGYITSGTVVPYWKLEDAGGWRKMTGASRSRSIALAYIDPRKWKQDGVEIRIRNSMVKALIMPYLLRSGKPPFSYAVTKDYILREEKSSVKGS